MSSTTGRMTIFLLATFSLINIPAIVFSETLYTKKSATKVYKEPSARSGSVETLGAGAPVETGNTEGKFYGVTTASGQKGYIFRFKLAEEPPEEGGNLSGLNAGNMKVSETSSSSSIRGLSAVSEKHAKNKGISEQDIQAVKDMEAFRISDNAVEQFLATRNLGEYQK